MTDPRDRRLCARLVRWFQANRRDLPWRRSRSPYRTWVSEVMLQQTSAEVVAGRFERFVARFPGVRALAEAPVRDVLEEWSGLGYYRRARHLHAAARACVAEHRGRVPGTFASLRRLPGIGDYTAGAIASLGFGEVEPAVDGNVARVWSRFEGAAVDITVAANRRMLAERLRAWIPKDQAAEFNEGLIELGATVCRPADPACGSCPIRKGCIAFQEGIVDRCPAARRRRPSAAITSTRGVLMDRRGRVLVVRRPETASMLAGFDELPGRWLAPGESPHSALPDVFATLGFLRARIGARLSTARHVITHHRIASVAYAVSADAAASAPLGSARFVDPAHLDGGSVTTETRKLVRGAGLAS